MTLLTKDIITRLPPLHSQEGQDPTHVNIIVKFFDPTSQWIWYVIEGEQQEDGDWEFFGWVSGLERELGYFTLNELRRAKHHSQGFQSLPIERDLDFGFTHTLAEVKDGLA